MEKDKVVDGLFSLYIEYKFTKEQADIIKGALKLLMVEKVYLPPVGPGPTQVIGGIRTPTGPFTTTI